jgi:hypothetical protein
MKLLKAACAGTLQTHLKKPHRYNPKKKSDEPKDYYGKAAQRIPVWALKPNQYNIKSPSLF